MVRIGITGHRILAELPKLRAGVEEALAKIEAAFPGAPWTVVSPLAEGADRLVAELALARPGTRLVAALPLPKADYVREFSSEESREAFRRLLARADEVIELAPSSTPAEAYEAVGVYVLDHSDVLVAIWDGQGAQGRGGTATIVRRARERGLPIAWVHAGNRKPGTLEPTSLGRAQGSVVFENF